MLFCDNLCSKNKLVKENNVKLDKPFRNSTYEITISAKEYNFLGPKTL